MAKFYGVRKGREIGVFSTWAECQKSISGYSGAEYKSFKTIDEAKDYVYKIEEVKEELWEDYIVAYVDGSYEDSVKKYGSGVVILKDDNIILKESFGGDDKELVSMRNVAGEIKAAEFAMNYCIENNYKNLVIYYDYAGIECWCTGVWSAGKIGTKMYKNTFENLKEKGLKVRFQKVKAHSGNLYNDMADELAKKGILMKNLH